MRNSSRLIKLPYSKVKYNGVSCPSIIPSILKYGNMEEKQLQSKHRWLLFTEPPLASCCYDWLTHLGRCSSLLEDIGWWVFSCFFFCTFACLLQTGLIIANLFLYYQCTVVHNAHTVLLSYGISHTVHMAHSLWCWIFHVLLWDKIFNKRTKNGNTVITYWHLIWLE